MHHFDSKLYKNELFKSNVKKQLMDSYIFLTLLTKPRTKLIQFISYVMNVNYKLNESCNTDISIINQIKYLEFPSSKI